MNGPYVTVDVTDRINGATDDRVNGALAAGEQLVIYDGVTALGTATVSNGTWTFTTPSLAASDRPETWHGFNALVVDSAGKQGAVSDYYQVRVLTLPPTLTLPSSGDNVTNLDVASPVVLTASEDISAPPSRLLRFIIN